MRFMAVLSGRAEGNLKRNLIIAFAGISVLVAIYFPGFSRLQQLKERNRNLEKEIIEIEKQNRELKVRIHKLKTDPVFLENVAREKMKTIREGEIIYKTE